MQKNQRLSIVNPNSKLQPNQQINNDFGVVGQTALKNPNKRDLPAAQPSKVVER